MGLRFLTSGESHGRALTGILEGIPSGLVISPKDIDSELKRRQAGYGRGERMKIEKDAVNILSGVRRGKTLGSPITLLIENRDWENWGDIMNPEVHFLTPPDKESGNRAVTHPRPGHADLAGALKYDTHDIRDVLERSSARETTMRVALGAIARKFLSEFGVTVMSYVLEIGGIRVRGEKLKLKGSEKEFLSLFKKAEGSPVRCPDERTERKMIGKINTAIKKGDSIGGIFEVVVAGTPAGLGSYCHWDRRLNARLAFGVMSIQAVKGVEIGLGFEMSRRFGSEVMDEIFYDRSGFYRKTNNAGGIEGGVSNGMPIVLRAVMKPIPTLRNPLASVDIVSKKAFRAAYERSDVCAVPSVSVIAEAMVSLIIADSFLEKFGGDSMREVMRNYKGYLKQVGEF